MALLVVLPSNDAAPTAAQNGAAPVAAQDGRAGQLSWSPGGQKFGAGRGSRSQECAQNVEPVGQLGGPSDAIAVGGGYAYVAAEQAGLRVLDVGDPRRATEVGFYQVWSGAEAVTLAGNHVYVSAGRGGLWILRFTAPSPPVAPTPIAPTQGARNFRAYVPLVSVHRCMG
ncbi:MAG: hypothetical protein HY331_08870 [Chloroflexi bacterium]|nr:hypothetical protein [Chloroflexota bacterium]